MGYTSTSIKKGTTLKEFFRNEFGPGVIDVAVPKSTEAYIAYKTNKGPVIGMVVLISRGRGTITYKEMDEGMHPYYYDCPLRIFKQLSPLAYLRTVYPPPTIEGAKKWRTEVAKRLKIKVH